MAEIGVRIGYEDKAHLFARLAESGVRLEAVESPFRTKRRVIAPPWQIWRDDATMEIVVRQG